MVNYKGSVKNKGRNYRAAELNQNCHESMKPI